MGGKGGVGGKGVELKVGGKREAALFLDFCVGSVIGFILGRSGGDRRGGKGEEADLLRILGPCEGEREVACPSDCLVDAAGGCDTDHVSSPVLRHEPVRIGGEGRLYRELKSGRVALRREGEGEGAWCLWSLGLGSGEES